MTGPHDPITVLHVDDEPGFADLAATYLQREDDRFAVYTVTSADDGLDVIAEGDVDCVVSDYDMPGRNGIQFLERVRESHPDLPFILYTGKGSEEVASDAISAGVTDYLQKETGTDQYSILANRIGNAVDRHRAEREVDRTRTQMRAIAENSADAIVVMDAAGRIRYTNPSFEEYFGFDQSEIEGEPLTTIMPERHREPHRNALQRYVETGERTFTWSNVRFHGRHRDGTEIPLSMSYSEYEQEGEQRFLGVIRDRSERARLEDEVDEQERRFRLVAENVSEVVWMIDPGTGETEYVNPAYEEVWGQPAETLYEDTTAYLDAVHPADRDRVEAANADLSNDGDDSERGGYDEEYRIVRPDGEVRWIHDRAVPVEDDDGEVFRVVGIASDVTERKQRELDLRAKQSEVRTYRRAVEGSVDLLAAVGRNYEFQFANDQFCRYFGLPPESVGDERLPDVVGEAWEPNVKEKVDRAMSGATVRYEMRRSDPDGDQRELDITYYPIWDGNGGGNREEDGDGKDDGTVVGVVAAMRDLTRLREREREVETVLSRVTDAVVEVDADWRFTLVNEQAETLYGMDEASLLGRGFWDVFAEALGTRFETKYRQVMKTREPTRFVEYFSQLDGWFDVHVYPTDGGGLVFYFLDVTDERERQRELEEANELLSTLVEGLPVGVLAEDASRDVLAVNERLLELFDVPESAEDLVGVDCEGLASEVGRMFEDPTAFVERIDRLVTEREPVDTDQLSLRDGRTFVRSYRPLELPEGEGHLWMYRDVTEYADTVAELESQEERLRLALDAGEMGIWELDLETEEAPVRSGRHDEIFGYDEPVDDWEFESFLDHVHPDDRDKIERSFEAAFDDGKWEFECRIERTDGECRWISVMGEFYDDDSGDSGRAIGVVEDVTEAKRRTEQLRRTNDRLEQFASMVSHDLRNPLSIALGRLELYRDRRDEEDLDAIERALRRMEEITTDLTALARYGDVNGETEHVDVADVAAGTWEMLDTASATLETEPCTVTADGSQLRTLLDNLFRNAISHGGPDVTVRVGPDDDGFYVEDTGAGILPAERDRVFEDGYSTGSGGSGIGLTIVRRIAESHEWGISLGDSDEGGARFEFRPE